jgi:hypothetical protein
VGGWALGIQPRVTPGRTLPSAGSHQLIRAQVLLELVQFSPPERWFHEMALSALHTLHLATLAPFTRRLVAGASLSNQVRSISRSPCGGEAVRQRRVGLTGSQPLCVSLFPSYQTAEARHVRAPVGRHSAIVVVPQPRPRGDSRGLGLDDWNTMFYFY